MGFVCLAEEKLKRCWLRSYAAHRTLIVRKLKGLEDIIPYTSVHWEMLDKGM